jgi:5-hydroxyisourate hydrolase
MSTVTTHVLDTSLGRPAAGVPVRLERVATGVATGVAGGQPTPVAEGLTDADGRLRDLGPDDLRPGTYRVVFGTGAYFARSGQRTFYPEAAVTFLVEESGAHYHVPLVLSPFAYSTYRGS